MSAFRCNRSTYGGIIAGVWLQLSAISAWAAEPAAPLPAPGSSLAIKREYDAQFDKRDWAAAAASAQKLVDAARLKEKTDPLGLADALVLLGTAEAGSRSFVSSELHFGEALNLVEGRVGPTSDRLIEPLTGLGYSLAEQGKHEPAIPVMERALVISRRNYGLFDLRQQLLLRSLAQSAGALRRITEGEKYMLYLLSIGERNYGRNDPRMVSLLCTVGNWYVENALLQSGRDRYRIALNIVEDRLGKNNLAAVEPLRGLAYSYTSELDLANLGARIDERDRERQSGSSGAGLGASGDNRRLNPRFLNAEGERSLMRALKILDENPSRPPQLLVETLIQLGDTLQLRNSFEQALPYYRRAAVTLTAEMNAKEGDATQLSFPVRIYYPVPLLATRNLNRAPEEVVERYVQTTFTITAEGAVKDVRVTDKDATPRQIAEATDAIRAARFRPKFVNGEPVETVDFVNREVFRQRREAE